MSDEIRHPFVNDPPRDGRTLGAGALVQLVGFILPFVLLLSVTRGPVAYLSRAAEASTHVRTAVALLFGNGLLTLALSIGWRRALGPRRESETLWLLAAAIMMAVTQAVDNSLLLAMVTLGGRLGTLAADPSHAAMAMATGITRAWTHTTAILAIDLWLASLYVLLYRARPVPRWVPAFGLATVGLHALGIPGRTLVGSVPVAAMGVPMAFSQITLAAWLMARGLEKTVDGRPEDRASP